MSIKNIISINNSIIHNLDFEHVEIGESFGGCIEPEPEPYIEFEVVISSAEEYHNDNMCSFDVEISRMGSAEELYITGWYSADGVYWEEASSYFNNPVDGSEYYTFIFSGGYEDFGDYVEVKVIAEDRNHPNGTLTKEDEDIIDLYYDGYSYYPY